MILEINEDLNDILTDEGFEGDINNPQEIQECTFDPNWEMEVGDYE